MTDKHPAPWRYEVTMTFGGRGNEVDYANILDANGQSIAEFDGAKRPPGTHGHLMARAPTLLAERDRLLAACRALRKELSPPVEERWRQAPEEYVVVSLATVCGIRDALALCEQPDAKSCSRADARGT